MASRDDLLDNEEFWEAIRLKLLAQNRELWKAIWADGVWAAYTAGEKWICKDLGIGWKSAPARGKAYYLSRGRKLTEELTETDLTQIRDLIEQNWGIGEKAFARAFSETAAASPERLELIYRNEIHFSNENGGFGQAKDAGVEGRSWLVIGDERLCEICSELADENQNVPMDKPFTNGEYIAHAHPRCRCRTIYLPKLPAENARRIAPFERPDAIV